MAEPLQIETRVENGWELITLSTDTGINYELACKRPETLNWIEDYSPVQFAITTEGCHEGQGVFLSGEEALDGWWAFAQLDEYYPGLAVLVAEWHKLALDILLAENEMAVSDRSNSGLADEPGH